MSTKMATPETAHKLLEELRVASREAGKQELKELEHFAKVECKDPSKFDGKYKDIAFPENEKFQQWDVSFYAEKMKEAKSSQPSPSIGDYELLLDPAIANAIQSSLAATPHEGFKPVVSIAPNGNVKIDFVPI